jgi:D-alanyl-D-alanine carboxypeptidase/D-alanyl-D-alanine-endopeptidase (penicillin-binding protein 4)
MVYIGQSLVSLKIFRCRGKKQKKRSKMVSGCQNWGRLAGVIVFVAAHFALACQSIASPGPSSLQKKISPLVGPRDSIMVSAPNGATIVSIHADKALVPASILKILTSLAAIETLGGEFRFKTEFYTDQSNNLIIKGYGDPLLISERLNDIASHLATLLSNVQNIILDDSYFVQPIRIPGRGISSEPYDAPNGALCVNFNTVAFTRNNGRWVTDEAQTPLLPAVIPKIEASGLTTGRITLVAGQAEALEYTGALFQYFLNRSGVSVMGSIERGRVNQRLDRKVWQYQSESNLFRTVAKLLEFSNNFIANQILLVLGAEIEGAPASVDKGLTVLKRYYHQTLGIKSGKIVEASGISRHNRITAAAMMEIIKRFSPHHELMREINRQYYKTGHLKGIRTRAGYIKSRNGGLYGFVVMLNTPGKSTHQIMRILEKELY